MLSRQPRTGRCAGSYKERYQVYNLSPDGAPISKVEATKGYGAEVCLVPGVYDDAYAKAIELRDEKGYTFIHPFDDENVIAGQGTIGLEILNQVANADVIVVPVGGGGLISGVAFTVKQPAKR